MNATAGRTYSPRFTNSRAVSSRCASAAICYTPTGRAGHAIAICFQGDISLPGHCELHPVSPHLMYRSDWPQTVWRARLLLGACTVFARPVLMS